MKIKNRLISLLKRLKGNTVRKWRPSWVPIWARLQRESDIHPHCPEERADLFIGYDIGSTEIEVLNWLYATVCLSKPQNILETGAAKGLGTIALASACKANGFGKVHSVEIENSICGELDRKLKKQRLREYVEIHCSDSLEYLKKTTTVFDFGFFDSMCEIRAEEFTIAFEKKIIRNIAVFHDTSAFRCISIQNLPPKEQHEEYRRQIIEFGKSENCNGFYESNLSRGIIALFMK